jgi:dethiobiotin synthase
VVSAALMARYGEARYWKPIQTGPDDDTAEVQRLSGCSRERVCLHGVRLPDPLSPHLAAQRANARINLPLLTAVVKEFPGAWIVEGAGGALVPVNEADLMVHLMERLRLPVVVVARTTLGTINHTLLTIEALRTRNLPVAGVVTVGDPNADNRAAIEHYGGVRVVGEMPRFDPLSPQALRSWTAHCLDADESLGEFLA